MWGISVNFRSLQPLIVLRLFPNFVNYWNTSVPIYLHVGYGWFCTTGQRWIIVRETICLVNPKIVTNLTLATKSLLISGIDGGIWIFPVLKFPTWIFFLNLGLKVILQVISVQSSKKMQYVIWGTCQRFFLFFFLETRNGVACVGQSLERPTFDFDPGHDPRFVRLSPALGSMWSVEPA